MKKLAITSTLLCILIACVWIRNDGSPEAQFNTNHDGVILKGYDPVSYDYGVPTRGKPEYRYTRGSVTYLFSSRENLETFKAEPEKYEPAYGGWCAYAMIEGDKVDINPRRFKRINGRTYLFYDRWGINTLKKWGKLVEMGNETALIEKADAQWAKVIGS